MNLVQHLIGEPPLEAAAGFLVRIKTAGWNDAPDMSGVLEELDSPVEEVLAAANEVANLLMGLMLAYSVLPETAKGLGRRDLQGLCGYGAETSLRTLLRWMAALGGQVNIKEVEPPPGTTDPQRAIQMLLRREQEVMAGLMGLKELVGQDNSLAHDIAEERSHSKRRIDNLMAFMEERSYPVLEQDAPEEAPEALSEEETKEAAAEEDTPAQRFLKAYREQGMRAGARKGAVRGAAEGAVGGAGVGAITGRVLKGKGGGSRGAALGALTGAALNAAVSAGAGAYRGRKKGERAALAALQGKSAAVRFKAALTKMAQEIQEGAEMTAPTGSTSSKEQAVNYLAAEQMAQEAQNMNEAEHYKQRFEEALMQNEMLQQGMAQTQQQLDMLNQQAAQAGQQIQMATEQAVQANDTALQQSQLAAQMRMGMQQMRAQMLQVASQEPDAIAAQMQQEQAQAEAAQIQEQAAMGQPPPAPATPQKAEEEAVQAENAQQQADLQTQQAQQAAEGAQMKMGAASDYVPYLAPAVGAALGGAAAYRQTRGGEAGLERRRQAIAGMEQQGGGFRRAMELAQAKAGLANAELAQRHPVPYTLMGAATGALTGAGLGKTTGKELKLIEELAKKKALLQAAV